jgi:hypothetical protein
MDVAGEEPEFMLETEDSGVAARCMRLVLGSHDKLRLWYGER